MKNEDLTQADTSGPALSEKVNQPVELLSYEAGDARIVLIGQFRLDDEKDEDLDELPFRALLEFPKGPPELPVAVIWNDRPCRLVPRVPGAELNFLNDIERDPVSLKSDTSSPEQAQ